MCKFIGFTLLIEIKVGDNVGDCAARGADLFESIAAEIISAMILGGTMAQRCKIEGKHNLWCYIHSHTATQPRRRICLLAISLVLLLVLFKPGHLFLLTLTFSFTACADASGFILFPLVVHSFDLVISSVGIFSIRRDSSGKASSEDPMKILQRGYSVTILLAVLTFGAVILH